MIEPINVKDVIDAVLSQPVYAEFVHMGTMIRREDGEHASPTYHALYVYTDWICDVVNRIRGINDAYINNILDDMLRKAISTNYSEMRKLMIQNEDYIDKKYSRGSIFTRRRRKKKQIELRSKTLEFEQKFDIYFAMVMREVLESVFTIRRLQIKSSRDN